MHIHLRNTACQPAARRGVGPEHGVDDWPAGADAMRSGMASSTALRHPSRSRPCPCCWPILSRACYEALDAAEPSVP